jgi:hypothetical protein
MIFGHRWTSHKAKAPLAGWCDDAGVSRLRHSDYGRIIFCSYVRISTTPRIMKVAQASRIRLAGERGCRADRGGSDEAELMSACPPIAGQKRTCPLVRFGSRGMSDPKSLRANARRYRELKGKEITWSLPA